MLFSSIQLLTSDVPVFVQLLLLCGTGLHKACRLCTLQLIRNELGPTASRVCCPMCVDGAKAAPPVDGKLDAFDANHSIPEAAIYAIQAWSNANPAPDLKGVRPLSVDEVKRFSDLQLSAALKKTGSLIEKSVKCPNPKCGTTILADGQHAYPANCPHCSFTICGSCGIDWARSQHAHMDCKAAAVRLKAEDEAAGVASTEAGQTFKRCPTCGTGITHYRAHGCHHITCSNCKSHWCYVCCGPHPCKSGCPLWCENWCDCPDCPDCRKGRPCTNCARMGCFACKGEGTKSRAERHAKMAQAIKTRMRTGWCGPRSSAPSGVATTAYRPPESNVALRNRAGAGGAAPFNLYSAIGALAGLLRTHGR